MGRAFEYRKAAKEKRWSRMSKIFPKLARAITVAAKTGGADPAMNPRLRTAIQNAKGQNMPKDNIDAAIKRVEGKDATTFTEINYEGKGPYGVLIFVECATDNPNRTVANIKSYFNKAGGGLVPSGSLEFMFDRKAVFTFEKMLAMDLEELELVLIDAGLEEIQVHENTVYVFSSYTNFGTLSIALEEKKIDVIKANLQRIPTNPITFSQEETVAIEKMLNKIEEDDDVQEIFTNIA